MTKAELTYAVAVEVPKTFTDVLYLTNRTQMPPEIKRLLKQKKLSYSILLIDKFPQLLHHLELIGTVIIDTKSLEVLQKQKLDEIIESLVIKNVGTILLSNGSELPAKGFWVNPTAKNFSLVTTMESLSVDGLWATISVNLAYRKKSSRMTAKTESPSEQTQTIDSSELAEKLRVAESVVDNLAGQLRIAGHVQRDFLPAQLPNCDRLHWATTFLPVEWVSGDIYDIIRIDNHHIGFYVADVVGHGIPAALLTIFLRQALVMNEIIGDSHRIFSPAEVMKNLNLRMTGLRLSAHQFASCCYCLLNTKTLQLTCSRAGHPYPILIKSKQPPQQLEMRGSLLGIFEQAEYIQHTIQLQSGDKLLLYSDGAEPFIGTFGDQSGFSFSRQFCEIKDLPITKMTDELSTLVQSKKIGPSEIDDDVTTIGLEVL